MTQILLGQSYYLRFDPKLWEAMQPYPPLGTLYAASWLRQHGYDIALFDAMLADSEEEWAKSLDEHKPRYAIIYEDNFNYLSKMCLLRMREAAFNMIHMAKSRGCVVILCGADATDHFKDYLEHGADYCILGEGEETLLELLNQLEGAALSLSKGKRDAGLESILGLAYESPVSISPILQFSNPLQSPPSRHHQPRLVTLPRLGFGGHRKISKPLVATSRIFFNEHGHHARLSVSL